MLSGDYVIRVRLALMTSFALVLPHLQPAAARAETLSINCDDPNMGELRIEPAAGQSLCVAPGASVGVGFNDYVFVRTANGFLSRYRVEANGTLAFQADLALTVPANDTTAFDGRGLLYVALGQQGVDPDLQVRVYAVDYKTGGLTLLQTKDVTEEPSRISVVDAGNADAIYLVSEDSLLLTVHVLNADGTIGAPIDQRDLEAE